eukprot:7314-Heterococcus_DN1.PRE.2
MCINTAYAVPIRVCGATTHYSVCDGSDADGQPKAAMPHLMCNLQTVCSRPCVQHMHQRDGCITVDNTTVMSLEVIVCSVLDTNAMLFKWSQCTAGTQYEQLKQCVAHATQACSLSVRSAMCMHANIDLFAR